MSPEGPERSIASSTPASDFLDWLHRWGWGAIPKGPIPPIDPVVAEHAREAAATAARAAGRAEDLGALRTGIARWFVDQYQVMGFRGAYFMGSLDSIERRREQLEVLTDAATAFALYDILPDETSATLIARFDVYHGGDFFGPTAQELPPPDLED